MPLSMNAVPLDSFYYFKDLEDQQQARELELARCSFSENQKKADVKDIRVNDVNEPESALPRDSAEGFIPAEQDVHRPFVESHYFGYLGKYRTEYFLAELEKDQQLGADSDAQTYQEKAKILPEEKRNQVRIATEQTLRLTSN
ncbi:hypothetical protein Q1695_012324 [Nippostrongylus brasiliensis]|nr:hypothetical protein Q1695_012324 [Nippostrongylus brasiliensis]